MSELVKIMATILGFLLGILFLVFAAKTAVYYMTDGKPIVKHICVEGREYIYYSDLKDREGFVPVLDNVNGVAQQRMCQGGDGAKK